MLLAVVCQSAPSFAKASEGIPGVLIVKINNSHAYELLTVRADSGIDELFPGVYRFKTKNIEAAQAALSASPWVEYAAPDRVVRQAVTTVDPYFTTSTGELGRQWYLPKLQVTEAWEQTRGSGITVAIVDTGVDGKHEDLNDGRVTKGYINYCQALNVLVENDCLVRTSGEIAAGSNSDDNGHGTIVAGIIGGIQNNNKGIAGMVWNVLIMPIKVLDASGTGLASDVAAGMKWAVDNGARVINLSLGGPGIEGEEVIQEAVAYAFNRGAIVVAAAGNDKAAIGSDLDGSFVLPVCADGGQNMIIGVAAVDFFDRKARFSNYGSTCIDIAAPGTADPDSTVKAHRGILSTYYDPVRPGEQALYAVASGTSIAAPMVAAAAVLMMSAFPDLDAKAIRDRLISSVDNIDSLNLTGCGGESCAGQIGRGRLNVLKALTKSTAFPAGTMVRSPEGKLYLIERGLKRPVSEFVFNQRFAGTQAAQAAPGQLDGFPLGAALPPVDGTLIKEPGALAVYLVESVKLHALSYLSFASRHLRFDSVVTLSAEEVASFERGEDAPVLNGALVKADNHPAIYILANGRRQLMSYFVFSARGFAAVPVAVIGAAELAVFPLDSTLYPPPDGTLFRGHVLATVYVVEDGARHGLSLPVFQGRGYSFGNVRVISQGEMDQYQLGADIVQ